MYILSYLGNMITNDASCTRKLNPGLSWQKQHSTRKKAVFTSISDLKSYIWSTTLCGAETWTLLKVDKKYEESLKCGAGEGWRRSDGPIV